MARKSRNTTQQAVAIGIPMPSETAAEEVTPTKYKTAIYTRLSVYDLGRENGNTIKNQVELLQHFVSQQPDLSLTDIYIDNGWTGTNFIRPEFQRLLKDAKLGRINCIVVKDLSRFGRNYLETGHYLQNLFPLCKLRFISVNDGYDSLTAEPDALAISMKNIINDYYSKDISRKVSSSLDLKRAQGVHSWGHAAYGYVRNPDNPAILEIDQEVAPYVSLIFQWAIDGVPLTRIAKHLTSIGAPTYQRLVNIRRNGKTRRKGSDSWTMATVRFIVTNQTYTGDFLYNKSYSRKYDPCNIRQIPENEWVIIPNAHPAYIDHEDFYHLREQIHKRKNEHSQRIKSREYFRKKFPDKFHRILYCGECQRRMRARWEFNQHVYMAYSCAGRKNQFHLGHKQFTMNAKTLDEIIHQQLNLHIKLAVNAQQFFNRISIQDDVKMLKARRQADLNTSILKLSKIKKMRSEVYEDFADGMINEHAYRSKMDELAREHDAATLMIQKAKISLDSFDKCFSLDNPWLRIFAETGSIEEITPELIHRLIRRVDVYSDKRVGITFNYADWMASLLNCIEEINVTDVEQATG